MFVAGLLHVNNTAWISFQLKIQAVPLNLDHFCDCRIDCSCSYQLKQQILELASQPILTFQQVNMEPNAGMVSAEEAALKLANLSAEGFIM